MKTLYLDCGMGAAGDMLTAALLELVPDADAFIEQLNALSVPHVRFQKEQSVKCGIVGTHVTVTVDDREECEDMHAHSHAHTHDHPHSSMHTIEHIVEEHLSVPQNVKADILAIYRSIAQAESHVHGVPIEQIHFHEVGTMDALADVTAVCLLMHTLSPDEVIASPVCVGSGSVHCAHGILPVPAPATAYILQGVPTYSGSIRSELCTPTGAALLRHFVTHFGEMPVMTTQKIGYGMGKKDFEAANCVRAMLGDTDDQTDTVVELVCNVDDMTAEEIGFAMERLFDAGAVEVFTVPVGMKKNRPGTALHVLCAPDQKERILEELFRHTSTLGVRETRMRRYVLHRETQTLHTPYGEVRCKTSDGYGVTRQKFEYEDLVRIATERGISLRDARKLTEQ